MCATFLVAADWPDAGVSHNHNLLLKQAVLISECLPCACDCCADWPDAGLEMEEKLSFFRETRHAFGRTALLLSGGGGLGSFHLVSPDQRMCL